MTRNGPAVTLSMRIETCCGYAVGEERSKNTFGFVKTQSVLFEHPNLVQTASIDIETLREFAGGNAEPTTNPYDNSFIVGQAAAQWLPRLPDDIRT